MPKDFYSLLGVSKSATEAEIKQAYRKLSKELHPDKHKGDKDKEAKFKEVNEAYEVLGDTKKRQAYDQFGSTNGNPFGGGGGSGGFQGFNGFDPSQFQGGDFSDLFESFFGGGGGRRGKAETRGRDLETQVDVTFMEAVTGTDRPIVIKAHTTCSDCGGSGGEKDSKLVTCTECGGTGTVTRTSNSLFGRIQQNVVCSTCKGSGKIPEKPCKKCNGEGRTVEKRTVSVHIPAGIDDGQTLRVKGEGEAGPRGSASGDLLVRIRVAPDKRFEREGDDIRSSLSITVTDAVLGTEATVATVHGDVTMTIPAGTQPNQVLRIKGKGMPVVNSSRTGDHFVMIDLVVPTKLSRKEKELFEELKGLK